MDGYIGTEILKTDAAENNVWNVLLIVHASSAYFHEHFEAFHLLPAVAEIDIVIKTIDKLIGRTLEVSSITKTKFTLPIRPETKLILHIDMQHAGIVSFSYKGEDGSIYSSGKIGYIR